MTDKLEMQPEVVLLCLRDVLTRGNISAQVEKRLVHGIFQDPVKIPVEVFRGKNCLGIGKGSVICLCVARLVMLSNSSVSILFRVR